MKQGFGKKARREKPPSRTNEPRSVREEPRRNLIYGVLPVLERLRANARRVEKVLIADGVREHRIGEILDLVKERGIPFQRIPRETLTKIVEHGANHQGVAAYTASADYVDADELVETVSAAECALVLVLDGIEDPRNLGAILRVAECSGVDGTFIPEHRAAGLNETVVKTSAGATEYTPVAKVRNLNRLIEELKRNNIWVIGASGEGRMAYDEWDWKRPTALVLGGEGDGLHRLVAENCDELVRIPMSGRVESLNVSVAAGVMLFEARRQRKAGGE